MTIGLATRIAGPFGGTSLGNLVPVTINGYNWVTLNCNTAVYSFLNNTFQTRFEMINGQNASVPGFSDPPYVLRSEVYSPATFAFDVLKTFSFNLLLRSGPIYPSPLAFLVMGQIHCDDHISGSPCFSFNLLPDGVGGEKLVFDRNFNDGSGNQFKDIGSIPFSRNTPYDLRVDIIDDNGGPNGYLRVYINNSVVSTFFGVVGYVNAGPNSSYPKFGIYGGGNGGSSTATPLPGQNIVAFYKNVYFGDPPDAFFLAANGSDSNPGTQSSPFATFAHASAQMTASPTKKTTYVYDTGGQFTAFTVAANQAFIAFPNQHPVITLAASGSGAFGEDNITLYGLTFNGSANDGGAVLLFGDCANLVVQACRGTITQYQQWIEVFRPGGGLRIQGNNIIGPTIGNNGAQGIFLINIVAADGADYTSSNAYIISDNHTIGGTFPIQVQCQGVNGIWSNWHCDRNTCTGWGDPTSTVGNEGISWVGSSNPANILNTCTGNVLTKGTGAFTSGGIEAAFAGCTYQSNTMTANFGFSIAATYNSRYLGNIINYTAMAFANDSPGGPGAPVSATIEINVNTLNGTPTTGPGSPTNLTPLPSGTGIPINPPSAPFTT